MNYVLLNTVHDFLVCLGTNFEFQNLAFITTVIFPIVSCEQQA